MVTPEDSRAALRAPHESGEQAAERVDEDLRTGDGQAHQGGGVAAAADGEQGLPEGGALQDESAYPKSTRAMMIG